MTRQGYAALALFLSASLAILVWISGGNRPFFIDREPSNSYCADNLRKIAIAIHLYTEDNGVPPTTLHELVPRYLIAIPTCWSAKADTYSTSYIRTNAAYTIVCGGANHVAEGLPPNFPQYLSSEGIRCQPHSSGGHRIR